MTDNDMKFRYFHIPPEHHAVVREYVRLLDERKMHMMAEHEAHQARMREYLAQYKEKQRLLWTKMCELSEPKVDADVSWDKSNWMVETSYLDHGFAALTTFDMPQHPLAALLGQQRDEEEEGVPEGTVLN